LKGELVEEDSAHMVKRRGHVGVEGVEEAGGGIVVVDVIASLRESVAGEAHGGARDLEGHRGCEQAMGEASLRDLVLDPGRVLASLLRSEGEIGPDI
jgi:hypothetical protein